MNTLKYIIKSFLQAQKAAQLQTVIKNTVEVNSLQHLQELFNWKIKPELSAYSHLYDVENFTDVNARRLRDAEVIAAVCANTNPEVVLEIGTSAGQTTAIMSQHAPRSQVYTVNIHPDEIAQGGELVTYAPSLDHIGKVYRQLGCKNVNQIIANTKTWEPDMPIDVALIDGCHDTEYVYNDTLKILKNCHKGSIILWHDFAPTKALEFHWLFDVSKAIDQLYTNGHINGKIIWLKDSWVGLYKCGGLFNSTTAPSRDVDTLMDFATNNQTKSRTEGRGFNPSILMSRAVVNAILSERSDIKNLYVADATQVFQVHSKISTLLNCDQKLKDLTYAFVYPAYSEARIQEAIQFCTYIANLGFKVKSIPIFCKGSWWPYQKLNSKYKLHLPSLRVQYARVKRDLQDVDVMVAAGGSMLHPDFVKTLKTYNIFICADDPEASDYLSKPVAPAFNHCFPINFATLDSYKSWGCNRVDWLFQPIPPHVEDIGRRLIQTGLGNRPINTSMFCERVYNLSNRASRIESLITTFPDTYVRGRGWPGGFITTADMNKVLTETKIGWNLHNSTGPCNTRFTTLPALGVMQICDNKDNIGQFFELNHEIVGFTHIEECLELTTYYLENDAKRNEIAYNGLNRTLNSYTLTRWWERVLNCITPYIND